jgi:hypothetical protein
VNRLLAPVPAGSYLVIAHPASDVRPDDPGTELANYAGVARKR